ncbi:hypothetical protein BGX26_001483 [Mortierella sp. AD094]|nr:hypothetical protein BGX26_001483 [Mortierella sp. AD094]
MSQERAPPPLATRGRAGNRSDESLFSRLNRLSLDQRRDNSQGDLNNDRDLCSITSSKNSENEEVDDDDNDYGSFEGVTHEHEDEFSDWSSLGSVSATPALESVSATPAQATSPRSEQSPSSPLAVPPTWKSLSLDESSVEPSKESLDGNKGEPSSASPIMAPLLPLSQSYVPTLRSLDQQPSVGSTEDILNYTAGDISPVTLALASPPSFSRSYAPSWRRSSLNQQPSVESTEVTFDCTEGVPSSASPALASSPQLSQSNAPSWRRSPLGQQPSVGSSEELLDCTAGESSATSVLASLPTLSQSYALSRMRSLLDQQPSVESTEVTLDCTEGVSSSAAPTLASSPRLSRSPQPPVATWSLRSLEQPSYVEQVPRGFVSYAPPFETPKLYLWLDQETVTKLKELYAAGEHVEIVAIPTSVIPAPATSPPPTSSCLRQGRYPFSDHPSEEYREEISPYEGQEEEPSSYEEQEEESSPCEECEEDYPLPEEYEEDCPSSEESEEEYSPCRERGGEYLPYEERGEGYSEYEEHGEVYSDYEDHGEEYSDFEDHEEECQDYGVCRGEFLPEGYRGSEHYKYMLALANLGAGPVNAASEPVLSYPTSRSAYSRSRTVLREMLSSIPSSSKSEQGQERVSIHYKLRVPLELWTKICSYLYPSQLARFALVNKTAYGMIASLNIWSQWFTKLYGPTGELSLIPEMQPSQSYMLYLCAISFKICECCLKRIDGTYQKGRLAAMPLPVVLDTDYYYDEDDEFCTSTWTVRFCRSCRVAHYKTHPQRLGPVPGSPYLSKSEIKEKYMLSDGQIKSITNRTGGGRNSGKPVKYSVRDALEIAREAYGGDVGIQAIGKSLSLPMKYMEHRVYIYFKRIQVVESGGTWWPHEEYELRKRNGLL